MGASTGLVFTPVRRFQLNFLVLPQQQMEFAPLGWLLSERVLRDGEASLEKWMRPRAISSRHYFVGAEPLVPASSNWASSIHKPAEIKSASAQVMRKREAFQFPSRAKFFEISSFVNLIVFVIGLNNSQEHLLRRDRHGFVQVGLFTLSEEYTIDSPVRSLVESDQELNLSVDFAMPELQKPYLSGRLIAAFHRHQDSAAYR